MFCAITWEMQESWQESDEPDFLGVGDFVMIQHGRVGSCLLGAASCTPRPRCWGSVGQVGCFEESWKAQGAETGAICADFLGTW